MLTTHPVFIQILFQFFIVTYDDEYFTEIITLKNIWDMLFTKSSDKVYCIYIELHRMGRVQNAQSIYSTRKSWALNFDIQNGLSDSIVFLDI